MPEILDTVGPLFLGIILTLFNLQPQFKSVSSVKSAYVHLPHTTRPFEVDTLKGGLDIQDLRFPAKVTLALEISFVREEKKTRFTFTRRGNFRSQI